MFISCSQFCRLMTRCDGKESVYISRPLSPSLVVLILSRIIQTRVFTKQNYLYLCKRLCVCVCVSFLDARAQQQGKDEEKRAKNENLKKEGFFFSSFLFFCLSLSLSSIFFLLKFSFFFLRSFFQEEPTKTLQKTTPQTTLRFARVYVLFYIL